MTEKEREMIQLVRESDVIDLTDGSELAIAARYLFDVAIKSLEDDLIIAFVSEGKDYLIKGSNFSVSLEDGVDADDLLITENGKIVEDFGETFAGQKLDASDILGIVIAEYVRNTTSFRFLYVCPQIKALKDSLEFSMGLCDTCGKETQVMQQIINSRFDKLALGMWYKVGDIECLAYLGEDNEAYLLVDATNGRILTDYEAFFTSKVIDDAKNETFELICINDDMRTMLENNGIVID